MRLSEDIKQLPLLVRYPRADANQIGDEVHTCVNCGHEYRGNYCPACGQKATAGRITWGTVRSGVMDVWGLGSRSLIRSLWQLVVRPGRLISDYINGKWQVSFPPVKMLVIVAVTVNLLGRLVNPGFWGGMFDDEDAVVGNFSFVERVFDWILTHPEWCYLLLFLFFIIPMWFVFRHSPRNALHTLPQGFFIMVFLNVQFYLALFVFSFVFLILDVDQDLALTIALTVILPLLALIDFKTLFGYGWWGTLWRLMVAVCLVYVGGLDLFVFPSLLEALSVGMKMIMVTLAAIVGINACAALLILVTDMVNRRTWRTAGWPRALRFPLIALGVMLASLLACKLIRHGLLFHG